MMTPEEVCQRVLSFRCPRVFITGGEPLLWREQVAKIASELHSRGLWVMIQSNGSIYAPEVFQHCSFVSLDYKTPSSGEESCADVIAQTVQNHQRVQVKFPVADENDLLFAISRSQELAAYGGVELVLQPVNRVGEDSTLDLLAKLKWLQEEVLRRGCFQFRVLPQLHIIVHGGAARGV
jgi:organic radical activating enzyme